MWLSRIVGLIVPKPDLYILLNAPAYVIQARKQEVPVHETESQRGEYLKLIKLISTAVVIDASQPLKIIIDDMSQHLIEHLAKTQSRRMSLPRSGAQ